FSLVVLAVLLVGCATDGDRPADPDSVDRGVDTTPLDVPLDALIADDQSDATSDASDVSEVPNDTGDPDSVVIQPDAQLVVDIADGACGDISRTARPGA